MFEKYENLITSVSLVSKPSRMITFWPTFHSQHRSSSNACRSRTTMSKRGGAHWQQTERPWPPRHHPICCWHRGFQTDPNVIAIQIYFINSHISFPATLEEHCINVKTMLCILGQHCRGEEVPNTAMAQHCKWKEVPVYTLHRLHIQGLNLPKTMLPWIPQVSRVMTTPQPTLQSFQQGWNSVWGNNNY